MNAYHALAVSYDRLTNDVDYEATVDFYQTILDREGLRPRTAVDLACGTGSVTALLAQKGLQVIGVDMSEEMLTVAQQKAAQLPCAPRFVCQRLEQLWLPRGVDLAVCALDSLDYITDPKLCRQAIARIYKALNPGGIFIFDVNTPEKLRAMDEAVPPGHCPDLQGAEPGRHFYFRREYPGKAPGHGRPGVFGRG